MIVTNHSREFARHATQLAAKPCKPLYKFTDISNSAIGRDRMPDAHKKTRILSNAGCEAEGALGAQGLLRSCGGYQQRRC